MVRTRRSFPWNPSTASAVSIAFCSIASSTSSLRAGLPLNIFSWLSPMVMSSDSPRRRFAFWFSPWSFPEWSNRRNPASSPEVRLSRTEAAPLALVFSAPSFSSSSRFFSFSSETVFFIMTTASIGPMSRFAGWLSGSSGTNLLTVNENSIIPAITKRTRRVEIVMVWRHCDLYLGVSNTIARVRPSSIRERNIRLELERTMTSEKPFIGSEKSGTDASLGSTQ